MPTIREHLTQKGIPMKARSEDPAPYDTTTADDKIIAQALAILSRRMKKVGATLSSPQVVKDYVRLAVPDGHEVFWVLLTDVKNRIVHKEEMFRGTLTHTSVYPREVVKLALQHNAAGVFFAHNHPSGSVDPSEADLLLTQALKRALALVDVRVLDHIIAAGDQTYSFAEHSQI